MAELIIYCVPMKKYELFGDEFCLLPPHDDLETMPAGAVQLYGRDSLLCSNARISRRWLPK